VSSTGRRPVVSARLFADADREVPIEQENVSDLLPIAGGRPRTNSIGQFGEYPATLVARVSVVLEIVEWRKDLC
jgi:hypothetical protein